MDIDQDSTNKKHSTIVGSHVIITSDRRTATRRRNFAGLDFLVRLQEPSERPRLRRRVEAVQLVGAVLARSCSWGWGGVEKDINREETKCGKEEILNGRMYPPNRKMSSPWLVIAWYDSGPGEHQRRRAHDRQRRPSRAMSDLAAKCPRSGRGISKQGRQRSARLGDGDRCTATQARVQTKLAK